MATTVNSKHIPASPEKVYKAFTDPALLEMWLVPGEMKGKIRAFDLCVGGGYHMCLQYPEADPNASGKTTSTEDCYHSRFLELIPGERVRQSINFESKENQFQGEMIMDVTLKSKERGTMVTITFTNIPVGINPKDNEEGTESSLQKLADLLSR